MLEWLRFVSPHPPSEFCSSTSQRMPAAIWSAACVDRPESRFAESRYVANALIAVAVESADSDSNPTQWPLSSRCFSRSETICRWAAANRRDESRFSAAESPINELLNTPINSKSIDHQSSCRKFPVSNHILYQMLLMAMSRCDSRVERIS